MLRREATHADEAFVEARLAVHDGAVVDVRQMLHEDVAEAEGIFAHGAREDFPLLVIFLLVVHVQRLVLEARTAIVTNRPLLLKRNSSGLSWATDSFHSQCRLAYQHEHSVDDVPTQLDPGTTHRNRCNIARCAFASCAPTDHFSSGRCRSRSSRNTRRDWKEILD